MEENNVWKTDWYSDCASQCCMAEYLSYSDTTRELIAKDIENSAAFRISCL